MHVRIGTYEALVRIATSIGVPEAVSCSGSGLSVVTRPTTEARAVAVAATPPSVGRRSRMVPDAPGIGTDGPQPRGTIATVAEGAGGPATAS